MDLCVGTYIGNGDLSIVTDIGTGDLSVGTYTGTLVCWNRHWFGDRSVGPEDKLARYDNSKQSRDQGPFVAEHKKR